MWNAHIFKALEIVCISPRFHFEIWDKPKKYQSLAVTNKDHPRIEGLHFHFYFIFNISGVRNMNTDMRTYTHVQENESDGSYWVLKRLWIWWWACSMNPNTDMWSYTRKWKWWLILGFENGVMRLEKAFNLVVGLQYEEPWLSKYRLHGYQLHREL